MATSRYIALLRGINVGGRNIIAKDHLKACFEDLGYECVRTHIQSGNVLFRSNARSLKKLTATIESGLSERFDYSARAVVLSHEQYFEALDSAAASWGQSATRKHNALFTLAGLTPQKILEQLPEPKKRLETVSVGPGVLFWSASIDKLSQTTMMTLSKSPLYQEVTVRNHKTVFKIGELLEAL